VSALPVFIWFLLSRQRISRIGNLADLRDLDGEVRENFLSGFMSLTSWMVLLSHRIIEPQSGLE
jgi:hypothetical protein